MLTCEYCGKVYQSDVTPLRCRCGGVTGYVDPPPFTGPPHQSAWVRLVKLIRHPSDKGVGDTVQRIAAKFGGEKFKAFAEKIGMPCGCTERQESWNRDYPY